VRGGIDELESDRIWLGYCLGFEFDAASSIRGFESSWLEGIGDNPHDLRIEEFLFAHYCLKEELSSGATPRFHFHPCVSSLPDECSGI